MSNWGNFSGPRPVGAGSEDEGPRTHQVGMRLPVSRPMCTSLVWDGTDWPKQGRQEKSWGVGIMNGVVGKESLGQDGNY